MKKNVVRALALVLVALMCLSLIPLAAHAEAHVHEMATDHQDPTCVEVGFDQTYCPICNTTFSMNYIPATGVHSFIPVEDEEYMIEEGDCTHPYQYWKSCSVCQQSAEEAYGLAVDELVEELTARKQSGEQADWESVTKNRILLLDERYKFSAGGEGHHILHVDRQEATCTSDGWKEYTWCDVCGERFNFEAIPAKGHRWSEFKVTKEATCTEDGSRERVCEVCDKKDVQVIPALGHTWTAFKVTKAATCTEDGSQERTCTVCGAKEVQVIPAAHKFGAFVVIEEPTCYASGTKEHTCTVCGHKETESIPAAHKFGEFVVTQEPTCYSTGAKQRVCSVCGETEVQWIDMAHKYENGVCVFCGEAQPEGETQSVNETQTAAGETAAYESAETEEQPDEMAPVSENIIYINFDGNGATSGSMDAQAFDPGTSQNLNLNAFVRTGYKFVGWDYIADGSGMGDQPFLDGEEVTLNSDVTLYAQWAEDPDANKAALAAGETLAFEDNPGIPALSGVKLTGASRSEVRSAFVGDELMIDPSFVPEADKDLYTYQWYRTNSNDVDYKIPASDGGSEFKYTVKSKDLNYAISCAIIQQQGDETASERTDALLVRKDIHFAVEIKGMGTVRMTDIDAVEPTVKIETNENVNTQETLIIDTITGNDFTIVMEPFRTDPSNLYYLKSYTATNNAFGGDITTVSEASKTVNFTITDAADGQKVTIFFDRPNCFVSTDEEGLSQADILDHQNALAHKNPNSVDALDTLRQVLADQYNLKKDEVKTNGVVYVTPKWVHESEFMTAKQIEDIGGVSFELDYPEGVSRTTHVIQVYHYKNGWGSPISSKYVDLGTDVITVKNYDQFSPFTVLALPSVALSFEANGGKGTMKSMTGIKGTTIEAPECKFTNAGKVFAGWNTVETPTEANPGTAYDEGDPVTMSGNITLYAQWLPSVTISFYPGEGGTGEMMPQVEPIGTEITLTENAFERDNFAFVGWLDQDGIGYADGGTLLAKKNLTLTAQWERTHYTISYDGNGGGGSMSDRTVSKNGSVTLDACTFTVPAGKIFAGWNTDKEATDIEYKDKETFIPKDDLKLYAIWKDKVLISYYPNNSGDPEDSYKEQYVPKGVPTALKRNPYTAPDGQIFAGWNTADDGSGDSYMNGQEVTLTEPLSLYAQWGDTITITYDPNGATASSRKLQKAAKNNDTKLATMSQIGYTYPGFVFKGWALSSGAKVPMYLDGAIKEGGFSQDTTLYAVWEQHTFAGIVTISGDVSGSKLLGFVGETLKAEVSGEKVFTDFSYQWLRDGVAIDGATAETFVPTAADFECLITCEVTANDALEGKTKSSINSKFIDVEDEEEKNIVNNGQVEVDVVYGVYDGMYYSINNGVKHPVTANLIVDGAFTVNQQGVYRFFVNETSNTPVGIVYVYNWWTIGFNTSTGTGDNSGSGTVTMKRGSTTLSGSTRIPDPNDSKKYILQPYSYYGYSNVWIVRQDAGISDITMNVKPASGSYGHVALNGGSYESNKSEKTYALGTITGPMLYDIIFNKTSTSPKTGDMSHLGLWSGLCLTSFVGAATILGSARKRKKEQD